MLQVSLIKVRNRNVLPNEGTTREALKITETRKIICPFKTTKDGSFLEFRLI